MEDFLFDWRNEGTGSTFHRANNSSTSIIEFGFAKKEIKMKSSIIHRVSKTGAKY